MKKYAIALTYACNWSCPYCAVRNSHDYKPQMSFADVMQKAQAIAPNSEVTLFGGEPGLLEESQAAAFITLMRSKQCSLILETNGTFLRNFPKCCNEFKEIRYHCSQDLLDVKFERFSFPQLRHLVVVTDESIKRLQAFLQANNDLKFDIIAATYPYEQTGPCLSNTNRHYILSHMHMHMTKRSIKRMLHEPSFDDTIFLT